MNCVTQKLKPLTKNDLTFELIGREVVWNSANRIDLKVGKGYEVIDIDLERRLIAIKDDVGDRRDMYIGHLAIPVKDQERKPVTVPGPEGFSDDWIREIMHIDKEIQITDRPGISIERLQNQGNLAEITHSCTLEFPNGETVTVPGPEGDDWNAETTRFDWPVVYTKVLSTTDRIKMHKEGSLIFHEYLGMLNREILKVRSITKWTRDPNYQPPEREETFEERAIRRYPSRMRGQG